MKALLILPLLACTGAADLQCPGPFGYYSTQLETCPDRALADGAVDILRITGQLNFDPGTINVSILDLISWDEPGLGTVEGLTNLTNTYVDRSQGPLLHELLHVHERPGNNPHHDHWGEYGYKGLDNFFYWWALGVNAANWQEIPCERPYVPEPWKNDLQAAGYDIAAWEAGVCP